MNNPKSLNEAIFTVNYTYFNSKNVNYENPNIDFESLLKAVCVNSCFIVKKLMENCTYDYSINKNQLITSTYILLIEDINETISTHSEELDEHIIERINNTNVYCPIFLEKIIEDNFRWKMILLLWQDQNVRKTLKNDDYKLYEHLLKKETLSKIENF